MTKYSTYLILFLGLLTTGTVRAETIELTITGSWSETDFKVTRKSDASYDPSNPKFDGKVFDLSPSDGNLSLVLLVNTDRVVVFPKGSEFVDRTGRSYRLSHDFYGYGEVTLPGGSYNFGGAVWKASGMLTGLVGPNGTKAALWTDVDITKGDPAKVSFRMFGRAGKLSADLFFGSRTASTIGDSFLLWEYYKGEEIRSRRYTARSRSL